MSCHFPQAILNSSSQAFHVFHLKMFTVVASFMLLDVGLPHWYGTTSLLAPFQ